LDPLKKVYRLDSFFHKKVFLSRIVCRLSDRNGISEEFRTLNRSFIRQPADWLMESVEHYIREGIVFDPVQPNGSDWAIQKMTRNKKLLIDKLVHETLELLTTRHQRDEQLQSLVAATMFLEQIRIKEDPWKVDPPDDWAFWKKIKSGLIKNEQLEEADEYNRDKQLLEKIISRYANEIAGTFRPGTYNFAKRAVPFLFASLLNAASGNNLKALVYHRLHIQDRVHLRGELDAIRNLATKGTVILLPTHFSNLDSILIGWSLHALGLPPFIYGAGLNLFNTKLLAYFMNRLGAYKVDRRKKNPIYLETLKMYSTIAIREGCHSLFFPGGTRSRSGALESRLKLGLMGTAIEAQRLNLLEAGDGKAGKIFVVPLVIGYHFVLEAPTLINQHLKRTGKELYFIPDESRSLRKTLEFLWKYFSRDSEVYLNFGKPMDIFGNFVDENGDSFDHLGRPVDIRRYFMTRGEMHEDKQRDEEYTRMLGEKVVERYHIENVVFSSHVVAFTAFQLLKKRFREMDLYELLRIQEEDRVIPLPEYMEAIDRIMGRLHELTAQGKVQVANHLVNDNRRIVEHGIRNLGLYHDKRPLRFQDENSFICDNMNLLYFYHNRLNGYELETFV
jgi:glycerol-3-phosphate O-acyltransferase